MPTLQDVLKDPDKRKAVVADCVTIIDEEVAAKGGFSGMAIKAGYKVIKGLKPGMIPEAVDGLIDDFAKNLQPLASEADEKGVPVADFLVSNKARAADAMLAITDARAKKTRHKVIKATYDKLRSFAKKNTEDAVPRVAQLYRNHVAQAG